MRTTKNMRVELIKGGFITLQDNPFVEKVIARNSKKMGREGFAYRVAEREPRRK